MLRVCAAVLLVAALFCCGGSPGAPTSEPPIVDGIMRVSAGRGASAIAAADVNGDGLLDLLVGNEVEGSLQPLLGDGRGSLSPGPRYPAGANPLDIAVGDFDRNGQLDCAIANHDTSGVTVMLGDGAGGFAPGIGSPFFSGSRPHVHSVA